MSLTLPPGWTGNDADHHADVGCLRLVVYRESQFHAFLGRNERVGPHLWRVEFPGVGVLHRSATTGHPDAADARKHAIRAARVVAMEITQGCDWLDMQKETT